MVTDVYSHIFNADRKHLARKVDEAFFCSDVREKTEKAAAPSASDSAAAKAIQLLQDTPELAETLLKMAQFFSNPE